MDKEKVHYIIKFYSSFFTKNEYKAWRHLNSLEKIIMDGLDEESSRYKAYKNYGWISSDETVLKLLADGSNAFYEKAAKRILEDHKEEITINNCPKCGRLTRTPKARQCRHCGYSWFS